jgi:hypothetical protein
MTSAPSTGARPPLRIACITKTPLPSTDAATVQIIQTAAALARAGVSFDLFFPLGEGQRRLPVDGLRARLSEHYGVELGFGLRQLRTTSRALLAVQAGLAVANDGCDILHTRDVQNVTLGLATGCRVVMRATARRRNTPIIKALLRRAFGHPRFLGQIIHSRFARERHLEAGYPGQKLRTIYNGFDPAASRPTAPQPRHAACSGSPSGLLWSMRGGSRPSSGSTCCWPPPRQLRSSPGCWPARTRAPRPARSRHKGRPCPTSPSSAISRALP